MRSVSIKGLTALREHVGKSAARYRRCPSLGKSISRIAWSFVAAVSCASFIVGLLAGARLGIAMLIWTLPVVSLYVVFVRFNCVFLRDPDGRPVESIRLANILTAIRIVLVPPILVLLFGNEVLWGSILYVIAAATDVADGIAARRLGQETALGLALDPVGDIVLTTSVFVFLWYREVVPTWLFVILVVRYAQFFIGLAVLALLGLAPKLSATGAGKVVGVVQAAGIVIFLAGLIVPEKIHFEAIRTYLVMILGVAFCSVIVSQTVIGWRAVGARHERAVK